MVYLTRILSRVPVIKFRAGGGGGRASPAPAAAAAPSASAAPAASSAPAAAGSCMFRPPAAPMSTGPISDIDLPPRYRRHPLTQEEIDHINGGGIKDSDPVTRQGKSAEPKALAVIKIPQGILIKSGKNKKEVVTLNIVLQKK